MPNLFKNKSKTFYLGLVLYPIIFVVGFNLGRIQAHHEYVQSTQVELDDLKKQVKTFVEQSGSAELNLNGSGSASEPNATDKDSFQFN